MTVPYNDEDLVIYILNAGKGDSIVICFPADEHGERRYAIVDCHIVDKTLHLLDLLMPDEDKDKRRLEFVCATHPHRDHVLGILKVLKHEKYKPKYFWDSGFRHPLQAYKDILEHISKHPEIKMIRVSAGMEEYVGQVQVTALAPSIMLRNRFATYGVDINNGSIVLRLEHHKESIPLMRSQEYDTSKNTSEWAARTAGKAVVILAGDAEFDSWAHVVQEFPTLERPKTHKPLVRKMVNHLACRVVKVSHHGSMHSTPLDVYEKMMRNMKVKLAVISTQQLDEEVTKGDQKLERGLFPHPTAIYALHEVGIKILTTDGSYEKSKDKDGKLRDSKNKHRGSVVIVVPPGGPPKYAKMHDASKKKAKLPTETTVFKEVKE